MAEIADLDGDGASDLVVEDGDEIVLLSGASGERVGALAGRRPVESLESLCTEQRSCVLIGGGGCVQCVSVDSRELVWRYGCPYGSELRVACVRRIPDVDRDGVEEVVAGFVWNWDGSSSTLETLREGLVCLSGATGKRLFGVSARLGDRLGHSIAGCGDWNGDGVEDFVAGAPRLEVRNNSIEPAEGHAFVISGRDGEVLDWLFARSPSAGFGWSCAFLDGERPRILLGAHESPGEGALYSCGLAQHIPRRLYAEGAFGDFGYQIHTVGDQDGDGVEDYAVSTVYQLLDCTWNGYVTIFSGADDCQLRVLRRGD